MGKLLDQVRPVARLFDLLYRANYDVIADALNVDLVATFRSRRRRRGQLLDMLRFLLLEPDGRRSRWAHQARRWWRR